LTDIDTDQPSAAITTPLVRFFYGTLQYRHNVGWEGSVSQKDGSDPVSVVIMEHSHERDGTMLFIPILGNARIAEKLTLREAIDELTDILDYVYNIAGERNSPRPTG